MKARDKSHYIDSWHEHVQELIKVCMDADMDYDEWLELRNRLLVIVNDAANEVFSVEEKA